MRRKSRLESGLASLRSLVLGLVGLHVLG